MRTTVVAIAVSTALWLAAPAAQGQSGQHQDGLWIGAGLGHGTMNRSCDSCWSGPRTGGTTGWVQVDGAVSSQVRVGAALHLWWQSGRNDYTSSAAATERLSNLGAVLHYYPAANGSFFVGGSLGLSNYYSKSVNAHSNDWGWGFTADAGYDIRLVSNVSLTPRVTYCYGAIGTVKGGPYGGLYPGWTQNVIELGLGVAVR